MNKNDYIEKQNGQTVWLNEAGKKLVVDIIDMVGGGKNLSHEISCSEVMVTRLKDGRIGPGLFDKFFVFAKTKLAA